MSRKNKLMLAAAIAAVALLIGSGVARCTLERADTDEAKDAIEAVEGNRSGSETSAPYEEEPAIQDDVEEPGGNDIDSLIGSLVEPRKMVDTQHVDVDVAAVDAVEAKGFLTDSL